MFHSRGHCHSCLLDLAESGRASICRRRIATRSLPSLPLCALPNKHDKFCCLEGEGVRTRPNRETRARTRRSDVCCIFTLVVWQMSELAHQVDTDTREVSNTTSSTAAKAQRHASLFIGWAVPERRIPKCLPEYQKTNIFTDDDPLLIPGLSAQDAKKVDAGVDVHDGLLLVGCPRLVT